MVEELRNGDLLSVRNLSNGLTETLLQRGTQREFVVVDETQNCNSGKCFVDARDVESIFDTHGRAVFEIRVSRCRGPNPAVRRLDQHSDAGIAAIDTLLQQRFHGGILEVCAK